MTLFCRHRRAVFRLQSRPIDARATPGADIRIGHHRRGPAILPLSIGDGELFESAITTVSVPEMFRYWLQGGRITLGFLGGAQIDRFGNLNTSVIGDYARPSVRLPGGGGAPRSLPAAGRS